MIPLHSNPDEEFEKLLDEFWEKKTMGGKPSKGTPADKRLKQNKPPPAPKPMPKPKPIPKPKKG
jgi:hypothetical protein